MKLTEKSKIKEKALEKAQNLGEEAETKDIENLDKKLPEMQKGVISKVWDKVLFLWEQAKSPEVPMRLKVTIVGALLYLVLPIDILPDYIPGIGLLDDMAVIITVFREVSKFALPKIEKKIERKIYESSYQKIDAKLSLLFSSILANTIIVFLVNVLGCVILVTKPFGDEWSRFVAYAVYVAIFMYALVKFIFYWKEYGKMTKAIAFSVYKRRSVLKGIADYVCAEYRYIAYVFTGIQIVNAVLPELQVPDLPQIISVFEKHYKRRMIFLALLFFVYVLLIVVVRILCQIKG